MLPIAIFVALAAVCGVKGQYSFVTCNSSYDWAKNSLGQDPCLVSAYLLTPCDPTGSYEFSSLYPGDTYTHPLDDERNACYCSSVTYNMISACSDCQLADYYTWDEWLDNCTDPSPEGVYPRPIESGTRVPAWAYIRPTDEEGNFEATRARNFSGVESSPPSVSGEGKMPHIGVIVGGVVGGIVGLMAIIGGIFAILFRRKRMNAYNQERASYGGPPDSPLAPPDTAHSNGVGKPAMSGYPNGQQPLSFSQSQQNASTQFGESTSSGYQTSVDPNGAYHQQYPQQGSGAFTSAQISSSHSPQSPTSYAGQQHLHPGGRLGYSGMPEV